MRGEKKQNQIISAKLDVRGDTSRPIFVVFDTVPDDIQLAGRLSGARNAYLTLGAALHKPARPRHWSLQRPVSKKPRIL